MPERFSSYTAADMITPARRGVPAVTASATAFDATRAIHCNVTGTITVQFVDDSTTTDLVVAAGMMYSYQIIKVTAGTGVVLIY